MLSSRYASQATKQSNSSQPIRPNTKGITLKPITKPNTRNTTKTTTATRPISKPITTIQPIKQSTTQPTPLSQHEITILYTTLLSSRHSTDHEVRQGLKKLRSLVLKHGIPSGAEYRYI